MRWPSRRLTSHSSRVTDGTLRLAAAVCQPAPSRLLRNVFSKRDITSSDQLGRVIPGGAYEGRVAWR